MSSDEELAGRVVFGDESALEELIGRYHRSLAGLIERYTGGIDVEDIYQETWMRVVGAIDTFDRQRRFSTWLFHIAINQCRDWHRRRAVRPTAGEDSEKVGRRDDACSAIDARALLAKLPVEQREVVVLRYYQDLSEAEMAQVLAIAPGTVKSRLHAALKKLALLALDEEARR